MSDGPTKVVYAALSGNVLVAVSKFVAAALSGSSAMLTEAIHSSADASNQILLLIGNKRSRAEPDTSHPFGYGLEVYFWTFVVAVIVMLVGGAASIVEGLRQIAAPEPIRSPGISFGVLALAALFEGGSLAVGYREFRRQVKGRRIDGKPVGMWRFIALSKDPNLYESLLEDAAALIGVGIAAVGVLASVRLGWLWADGAASIAIGLLLVADSIVIAAATQSLIAGEAAVSPVVQGIQCILDANRQTVDVAEIKTLHLGPRSILVALTLKEAEEAPVEGLGQALNEIAAQVRGADPRINFVYFGFAPNPSRGPIDDA